MTRRFVTLFGVFLRLYQDQYNPAGENENKVDVCIAYYLIERTFETTCDTDEQTDTGAHENDFIGHFQAFQELRLHQSPNPQ